MQLKDIKELSYLPQKGIMEIKLHKRVNHEGFMRDTLLFKCSWDTFLEKTKKWKDYLNTA